MWYAEMFAELESQKDEEKAPQMAAYMKNRFPFLGLQKPERAEIVKPYIKRAAKKEKIDWGFIDACWLKSYREAQYVGVDYLSAVQNKLQEHDLAKLQELITTKSWWDTSDSLAGVVGFLVQKYPALVADMLAWSKSENIWLRRVAILFQLKYKEKTDVDLLEKIICANFGSGEFFIDKAIGWILREYSKVNPGWVRGFIRKYEDKMAKLSIKEGSKYI